MKVIAIGTVAVLAFDSLASIASRVIGFPYAMASIGSWVIYFAIGLFAARAAPESPIPTAALAAAIAGVADASLGWFISWQIGPGRLPPDTPLTVRRWIGAAIFVVGVGLALGALGGTVARRSLAARAQSG